MIYPSEYLEDVQRLCADCGTELIKLKENADCNEYFMKMWGEGRCDCCGRDSVQVTIARNYAYPMVSKEFAKNQFEKLYLKK